MPWRLPRALWLAESRAHLPEAADALLDRRVGGEQARDPTTRERLHDVQRLGGLVDLHRDRLRPLLEPQERGSQRLGIAADLGPGRIGRVLALARDRELDQRSSDRSQQ